MRRTADDILQEPAPSGAGYTDKPATASAMQDVVARMAEFAQLSPSTSAANGSLDLFNDIPITLTARLGQAVLNIGEMLKLGPGATVALDREVQQPVELVVGGKVFARGEVVVVNDRFAVRIKELAIARPGSTGAN